ncbi:MAG TPA: hypothetical protein VEX68_15050 [Bryobacteraceae bacterium]|nr:hypothetical protein [Bryobacteraceae bacterium]
MSEQQLYLSIGIPSTVALVGILVNIGYFVIINTRIQALETRLDSRINSIENRLESKMSSLEGKFDLLVGKVVDIDNRLTRVEEQLKHLH